MTSRIGLEPAKGQLLNGSSLPSSCGKVMELEQKMKGTAANPVQIDKFYFNGKIKYGRGHLLMRQLCMHRCDEDLIK